MAKKREQIKEKILIVAKRMFAEKGYDAANIQDISDEAQVNVAMISYYFGGKENLYQEVFKTFNTSQNIPDFMCLYPNNPTKALEEYLNYIFTHLANDKEIGIITYQELLMSNPRLDILRPYIKGVWEQLYTILKEGEKQKAFTFYSLPFTIHWIGSFLLFPKYEKFLHDVIGENIEDTKNTELIPFIVSFLKTPCSKE
ncbi:TetR family transcriptional regulator [Bacillus cereus]|uniref:TetR family transcriptional regulator n=1 Tax=Bacillus cereus TaxID=1396 RepID=A0A9X6U8J0_BACCE|nr:TetR/AcrR family transcriptional regulator [Bacillus cereus]PEN88360.1 TetR family transcriptional regulator [Bacillus cereus]